MTWAPSPALGDETKPSNFPDCTKYSLPDGRTVCGYTNLEDWKIVLKADLELTAKKKALTLERERAAQQGLVVAGLKGQVEAFKRIVAEQSSRIETLTKDLLETDRKYQSERVKPRWGNPLAWAAAAVATAALGGFVLHDFL